MSRILILAFVLTGCGSVQVAEHGVAEEPTAASASENVKYFYGDIHFIFSDGRRIQSRLLLERRFEISSSRIVERFWQPPKTPGSAASESVFTLTLIQRLGPGGEPVPRPATVRTAEFAVSDDREIDEGSEVFHGSDWRWTGWNYAFRTRNGTLIRGVGHEWQTQLEVRKDYYRSPRDLSQGRKFLTVEENLKQVDEKTYAGILEQMQSGHWGV